MHLGVNESATSRTWRQLLEEMIAFWQNFIKRGAITPWSQDQAFAELSKWARIRQRAMMFLGSNLEWLQTIKLRPAIMVQLRLEAYVQYNAVKAKAQ